MKVLVILCMGMSLLVAALGKPAGPPSPPRVGQPQFHLQGGGGGRNLRNFNAGFNMGVGAKVWESRNKMRSLDLGASYGRGVARVNGQTFKSPPQYGIQATYKFRK